MSKAVTKFDKINQKAIQKISNPTPALREVNVPMVAEKESDKSIITAYKDLNQPLLDLAAHQKRNFFIALFVFTILGLGILMGQHFNKSRVLASSEMSKMLPAGAQITDSEHYQYEKSCYTSENGERVCMTRTSQKH